MHQSVIGKGWKFYQGVCGAPVCQINEKKLNGVDFPAAIRIWMCFYFCIFFVCISPTLLILPICFLLCFNNAFIWSGVLIEPSLLYGLTLLVQAFDEISLLWRLTSSCVSKHSKDEKFGLIETYEFIVYLTNFAWDWYEILHTIYNAPFFEIAKR